jgi:hypothetical protein
MTTGSTSRMTSPHRTAGWLCLAILFAVVGCEPNASGTGSKGTPTPKATSAPSIMAFPEALHADDPEINAFIEHLVATCVAADYDAFRLMWSALEEPLGEQEFLVGFRATRHVTVLDLAPRRTREGEIVYLLYCMVELDPDVVPEPKRDIVLLLRQETGSWRIARPPHREAKALKAAFAEKHGITRTKPEEKPSTSVEIIRGTNS